MGRLTNSQQPIKKTGTSGGRLKNRITAMDFAEERRVQLEREAERLPSIQKVQEQTQSPVTPTQQSEQVGAAQALKSAAANLAASGLRGIGAMGAAIEAKGKSMLSRGDVFNDQAPTASTMANPIGNIAGGPMANIATQISAYISSKIGNSFFKTKAGQELKKALGENLSTAGGFVQETSEQPAQRLEEKYVDPSLTAFGKEDPEWGKLLDWKVAINDVAKGTGSMIPALAAAVATRSPSVLMLTMGIQEKGDAYKDYTNALAKNQGIKPDELSDEDIQLADEMSDYYGVLSGVLDRVGIWGAIEKIGGKKKAQDILKRAVFQVPRETLITAFKEGSTEGIQKFTQNLIAKFSGIDPDRDPLEGVAEEAAIGGLTGGAFGAVSGITPGREEATAPSEQTQTQEEKKPLAEQIKQETPVSSPTEQTRQLPEEESQTVKANETAQETFKPINEKIKESGLTKEEIVEKAKEENKTIIEILDDAIFQKAKEISQERPLSGIKKAEDSAKNAQTETSAKNAQVVQSETDQKLNVAPGEIKEKPQEQAKKPKEVLNVQETPVKKEAPKVSDIDSVLVEDAKKHKSANEFLKAHGLTFDREIADGEKRLIIDLFPDETIRGKGITKGETLNAFKNSYNEGHHIIEPSNGLWTRQGKAFIEKLKDSGVIKNIANRGGIERYEITEKINEVKIDSKLTDIWNKANEGEKTPTEQPKKQAKKTVVSKKEETKSEKSDTTERSQGLENNIGKVREFIKTFNKETRKTVEKRLEGFRGFVQLRKLRSGDDVAFLPADQLRVDLETAFEMAKAKNKRATVYFVDTTAKQEQSTNKLTVSKKKPAKKTAASRKKEVYVANVPDSVVSIKETEGDKVTITKPKPKEIVAPKEESPEGILKAYDEFVIKLRDGNVSLEEYKSQFELILNKKEAILRELNSFTKDKLLSKIGLFRASQYRNEKKDLVVNAIYDDIIREFALDKPISFTIGKGGHENSIKNIVENATENDLKEYAESIKQARKEREERQAATKKALESPETLKEFEEFIHFKGKNALSQEQTARYDELIALKKKEEKKKELERKATVEGVSANVPMELVDTKHTRDGYDLFVVKMGERVDTETYRKLLTAAKKLGGWYSSYRVGGAVPGFQFKDKASAQSFMAAGSGETVKSEKTIERKEDKKQAAAERLLALADSLEKKANEELNKERLTNTAKRAREAGYAEENARKDIAFAKTIRNIAKAIASGKTKFLDAIKTKTHVKLLDEYLHRAFWEEMRKKGISLSVAKEEGKNYNPTVESVNYTPRLIEELSTQSVIRDIVEPGKKTSGYKRMAAQIEKVMAGKEVFHPSVSVMEAISDIAKAVDVPSFSPVKYSVDNYNRFKAMGMTSDEELRAMLREYVAYKEDVQEEDKAKKLERELVGVKDVGFDFFPTPKEVSERMVDMAEIEPGMKVLEPSAGNGNIAEAIRSVGVEPDVAEISSKLREILEAKGFRVVDHDFMDVTEKYDRIIMNPPFSNNLDIEHIRHAYDLLNPGGKLVSVVGEGAFIRQGKKETAFREWLDEIGADIEQLPENTFTDKSLLNTTGANARLITLEKGEDRSMASLQRLNAMSDAQFVKSVDFRRALQVLNEQLSELNPYLASNLGIELVDASLGNRGSAGEFYPSYKGKNRYIKLYLAGADVESLRRTARHEETHLVTDFLMEDPENKKTILDWYNGLSIYDKKALFKGEVVDSYEFKNDLYLKYIGYNEQGILAEFVPSTMVQYFTQRNIHENVTAKEGNTYQVTSRIISLFADENGKWLDAPNPKFDQIIEEAIQEDAQSGLGLPEEEVRAAYEYIKSNFKEIQKRIDLRMADEAIAHLNEHSPEKLPSKLRILIEEVKAFIRRVLNLVLRHFEAEIKGDPKKERELAMLKLYSPWFDPKSKKRLSTVISRQLRESKSHAISQMAFAVDREFIQYKRKKVTKRAPDGRFAGSKVIIQKYIDKEGLGRYFADSIPLVMQSINNTEKYSPASRTEDYAMASLAPLRGVKAKGKPIAELVPIDPEYRQDYQRIVLELAEIVKNQAEFMEYTRKEAGGLTSLFVDKENESGASFRHRASQNPEWYRRFYREHKRKPNKTEMLEIALKELEAGRGEQSADYRNLKAILTEIYEASEDYRNKTIEEAVNAPDVYENKYTLRRLGIKKGTNKTVKTKEKSLLKAKIRAIAKGSRMGYSAGRRDAKAEIVENLRTSQDVKKQIAEYAKAHVPVYARGPLLDMVARAKTQKDLMKAFLRIDKHAENTNKKRLLNEVKQEIKEIAKAGNIAIDYKKKIMELVEMFDFTKRRSDTLEQIKSTKAYLEEQLKEGKDVFLPARVLNSMKILEKKPVQDITVAELSIILDDIRSLRELGENKLSMMNHLYALEKEKYKKELIAGTKAIEDHPEIRRKPGETLTFKQKMQNALTAVRNKARQKDLAITPMDAIFDMLDGDADFTGPNYKVFKKRIDRDFSAYLDHRDRIQKDVLALSKDLKLDEQNFERIGVYAARMQEGGMEKLINSGLTEKEAKAIELTESEMKMYQAMREVFDSQLPQVQEFMRKVYNQDVRQVKNYFSFMTDFDAMSETEIFERFGANVEEYGGRPRKTVEQGFTKGRVGGKQAIKLNAMTIFLRHTDNVSYLLNVAKSTKMLHEIANSQEYKAVAGERGARIVLEWLDTVARKGGLGGDRQLQWLDKLRANVGAAVLGFKLSSMLIQPTALLDGASKIGKYAFIGANDIAYKEWRKFLMDNLAEVRDRVGDDPSFLEEGFGRLEKLRKAGYKGIQVLDSLTASSIAAGAYRKYLDEHGIALDLEKPNQEAIEYAQQMLRRTQSSSFFKDAPQAISRGNFFGNRSIDKAFFQFQNFLLNRWALVRHDAWRLGIKKGNYAKTVNIFTWLILANAAAVGIRIGSTAFIAGLTGDDEEKKDDETYFDKVVKETKGNVPFVSKIVGAYAYESTPIPSLEVAMQTLGGLKSMWEGKKDETKIRGGIRALAGVGKLSGIPGMTQAEDIIKRLIKPKSNAPKVRYGGVKKIQPKKIQVKPVSLK
jgi:phospholipid N-methyltransferase